MSTPDVMARLNEFAGYAFEQNVRMRRRVSVLEARDALREAGRRPRMPIEFRSQFGEDLVLWDFFAGQLDGFFIEVGAFDGYYYSVSYAFEAIGWNGLLIEAIPERYEQCVQRRPHSRVVHAALSGRGAPDTVEFTVTEDPYGGMLSYLDVGTKHAAEVKSLKHRRVKVPQTTINDLLAGHQGPIDFASIDVEGVELLVMDGFDLEKHRPKVLMIEENSGDDPALTRFMAQTAYKEVLRLRNINRIYIRPDLMDQWERCMQR
jgi:FkbM family methyltransferase